MADIDLQGLITVNTWNAVTAYYSVVPVYKLNFPSSISVAKTNDISSNLLINAWNAVTALYEAVQPPVKHIHVPCIADALLREAKPTQNFGNAVTLGSGYSLGDSARLRSIMKFDVASVTPGLSMTGAYLRIYSQGKPNPPVLQVYQVLTDWTEYGVTWNGQPGVRFIPEIEVQGNTEPGFIEFDITQLFSRWYNNLSNNYGVLIKLKDETLEQIPFYSREYPNDAQKPEILFLYKIEATPARISLSSSISVRGSVRTQISGSITSRRTSDSKVSGNVTVSRLDTLPSKIKVHRKDTLDCYITVYKPSVMPCEISVKRHDALFASITVSVGITSDVASNITVGRPDTLPCKITVNRADALPANIAVAINMLTALLSTVTVRRSFTEDLSSNISARRSDANTLSSSVNIRTSQNNDFSCSVIISKKEITGSITPSYRDKVDISSGVSVRQSSRSQVSANIFISRGDMPASITTRAVSQIAGSVSSRVLRTIGLPSKLGINIDRINGSITVLPASNLSASIRVISGWLACSISVIATSSLHSQITVRQRDVSEIRGEITVGRGGQNTQGMVMYIPGGML